MSKTKKGLQKQIDIMEGYSDNWKLKVNIEKTKVIIFNKRGRLIKDENISCKGSIIESVKYYKYLGLLLDSNGKFYSIINDPAKKGLRVSHSIYKLLTLPVPRILVPTPDTKAPAISKTLGPMNLKFCRI